MKKKLVSALAVVCAGAMMMAGCQSSNKIETDNLTISGYKGIEVSKVEKPQEVTDEEVDSTIQSTLEAAATQTEVTDRAVEAGDVANINYVGKIDGEEFEGGSAEDYDLTIGSGVFIEGFEDSIIGHNIGDTFDWEGSFPEDYGNADYAGKAVTFTITVNKISLSETPELTKDVVKQLSKKSKTVKEYKAEVKEQLKKDTEATYKDTLTSSVWEAVMDKTEVKKYPSKKVKEISDSLVEQYKSAAEYYQMDYETFIQEQMQTTVEDFEVQVEDAAKSSLKQTMITEAIADKEKIELTDDVYKKQLKKMAKDYGYEDVASLKEAAEEKDLKELAMNNLVKEWLTENCIQVADSEGK